MIKKKSSYKLGVHIIHEVREQEAIKSRSAHGEDMLIFQGE